MKGKLLKDISAGTIQVIINQGMGLWIFIIISRFLDKAVYGELNWSLAVLTFITTILSLRLEQVVVRKVAAGTDPSKMLTVFFGHIVFSGLLFYMVLLACSQLFPAFFSRHDLLLVLAISQILSFFSLPFKQVAAGKEAFGWVAVMSSVANGVRAVWLLWLVIFSTFTITQVLTIYIISSLVELLLSMYLVQRKLGTKLSIRWALKDYFVLINESLPQVGVVFLNACIARADWILLGLFSTQVITAEYSFAYKVFEMSPIPMLIIAPVLLSRFSRYFGKMDGDILKDRKAELSFLVRIEMILATLLPLILNMVWTPLMDLLTHHKYGAVNRNIFFILSLSIPFQYLINLFWTIEFAQDHLARIFRITAITCVIVVGGNCIMIPLMNAQGAAWVYLTAMVVECFVYFRVSIFSAEKKLLLPMIACMGIALLSGLVADNLDIPVVARLLLSVTVYAGLLIVTGQVKRTDINLLKQWLFGSSVKFIAK